MTDNLGTATSVIADIFEACRKVETSSLLRDRFSVLAWQLALEHSDAIVTLVRLKRVSSARALLRCEFEAMVRGAWLSVACGEGRLDDRARFELPIPDLTEAVRDLTRQKSLQQHFCLFPDFDGLYSSFGEIMHDTVHQGLSAMSRVSHQNNRPNEVPPDQAGLLALAVKFAVVAGMMMLHMTGREQEASDLCDATLPRLKLLLELAR